MSLVLVLAFVVLMVLAIPVGHGLIIAAAVAVLWDGGVPLMVVVQQMFDQTQSFPMLALPFFMLAGALMLRWRSAVCRAARSPTLRLSGRCSFPGKGAVATLQGSAPRTTPRPPSSTF